VDGSDFRVTLRKLTVHDDEFVSTILSDDHANTVLSSLDPEAHAFVLIGALIALDAAAQSFVPCVQAARRAGASNEQVAGALIAAISAVGVPRVVSAAPKIGLALGYDLDAALESAPE
jgi:4-carboxymuconolactone decarboxylase